MTTKISNEHFFRELEIVAAEAGIAIQNKEEFATYKKEQGGLVLYEAANRAKLSQLAHLFLQCWQTALNHKLATEGLFYQGENSFPIRKERKYCKFTFQEITAKLTKILFFFHWPKLVNETMLYEGLSLPAKEIIHMQFHQDDQGPIPKYVPSYLGLTDTFEDYLIEKYAHLREEIAFSRKDISDQAILASLHQFQQATRLDLTGCLFLTKECLRNGHPSIETIILTGTGICEADIPKELFPNLKKIEQDTYLKVFHLDFKGILWLEIRNKSENADRIIVNRKQFKTQLEALISYFNAHPNEETIQILVTLIKKEPALRFKGEFSSASKRLRFQEDFFSASIIEVFLNRWSALSSVHWTKPGNTLGKILLQSLMELAIDKETDPKIKEMITKAFQQDLQVPLTITERDVERIRYLLKALREVQFANMLPIQELIAIQIKERTNDLFFREGFLFPLSLGLVPRGKLVCSIELLQEIYIELSYYLDNVKFDSFDHLVNPHKAVKPLPEFSRNHAYFNNRIVFGLSLPFLSFTRAQSAGPHYKEITDQSIACVFASQLIDLEARENLLKNILLNFFDYKSDTKWYPLPKLILGTIEKQDIPPWDCHSALKDRLLQYQGIFSENISEDLKNAFWQALLNRKLNSHTTALVEGLVLFYKKTTTPDRWKKEVLPALKKIGELNFLSRFRANSFIGNSLKTHARETFRKLSQEE